MNNINENLFNILSLNIETTTEKELVEKVKYYKGFLIRTTNPETYKETLKLIDKHLTLLIKLGFDEYKNRCRIIQDLIINNERVFDISDDKAFDNYYKDNDINTFIKITNSHSRDKMIESFETRKKDNESVKKPVQKKKDNRKFAINKAVSFALAFSVAFGLGVATKSSIDNKKALNNEHNVCVEYYVQEGQGYNNIKDLDLKDYGFSEYGAEGPFREEGMLYVGDVIIGRTTKENADKLVGEGKARIISLEEAIEKLGKNHSLIGEFRKVAEGKSDFVFYEQINKSLV